MTQKKYHIDPDGQIFISLTEIQEVLKRVARGVHMDYGPEWAILEAAKVFDRVAKIHNQ